MIHQHALPDTLEKDIQRLRKKIRESAASQKDITFLTESLVPYKHSLFDQVNEEMLAVRNEKGGWDQFKMPRWICHFMGLPHRCVHILLLWERNNESDWPIFQMRSWAKDDSPNHLDLSAAGHIVDDEPEEASAFSELFEELGLREHDLAGNGLTHVGTYSFHEDNQDLHFYNSEWRICFVAHVPTSKMENIHFQDGEVSGLFTCPMKEAKQLLSQKTIPMASALTQSFPRIMGWLNSQEK